MRKELTQMLETSRTTARDLLRIASASTYAIRFRCRSAVGAGIWFVVSCLCGLPVLSMEFKLIGSHPTAPLTAYPAIRSLKAFDGKLYLGYGDWDRYPVTVIASYQPISNQFELEFSAPSDALGDFREIDGTLFLPSIDPGFYEKNRDYSYLKDGVWRDASPAGMLHAFDLATVNGSDLWLVGHKSLNETHTYWAAVYRSVDGGRTWQDLTFQSALDRYYWCFPLRGRLYVRDAYYEGTNATRTATASHIYFSKATPIGSNASAQFVAGLAGKDPAGDDSSHPLVTFDGDAWRTIRTGVYDFTVRGTNLFTLESRAIWMASDLTSTQANWQRLESTNVPPTGRSIEVLNDVFYIGDAGGRLWAARLDGGLIGTNPPTILNSIADEFGRALSFDGNLLAVGSPDHSGGAQQSGQVSIWQTPSEADANWRQIAIIDPPAPSLSGWFGKDLALKDHLLAVVEAGKDNTRSDRGVSSQVHLYEGDGTVWRSRTNLNIPYAKTVAIDSDWLAVGASVTTNTPATRLLIYKLASGPEGVTAKLQTNLYVSAPINFWKPHASVALEGDICVIGSASDPSFNGAPGQVKVFHRDDSETWRLLQTIASPGIRKPITGGWRHNSIAGAWQADGEELGFLTTRLTSSPIQLVEGGQVQLLFNHRWSIESFDGGQVRISVNGAPFTTVTRTSFTQSPYNASVVAESWSDIRGQNAFVGQSSGYSNAVHVTSVCSLGILKAGDTVSIQFLYAANDGFRGKIPNWEIDSLILTEINGLTTNTLAADDFNSAAGGFTVTSENSLPTDHFGYSIALKDGWLAVGGPRADEMAIQGGAVHLYQKTNSSGGVPEFVLRQSILSPTSQPEANFGTSVALQDGQLLIGAPGTQLGEIRHHGAVYKYTLEQGIWRNEGQVDSPSGSKGEFGLRVAFGPAWIAASSRFSKDSENLSERLALQPLASNDVQITSVRRLAGHIELVITAEPNRTYALQWTSNLSPSNWRDLLHFTTATATTNLMDTTQDLAPWRFYRIRSMDD